MRLKFLVAGLMASSLVAAPAMANSASALSVAKASNVKATTSSKKVSKEMPTEALILAGLGGAAIVAVAATNIFDGNDDSDSN